MGERLSKYYAQAYALGDMKAQMRLAVLTLMSSTKAQVEPDSLENIAKFEKAMQEIKREYKSGILS